MVRSVTHDMENDLNCWFNVHFIVTLVKLESLLAKHAAFEEFYAKRSPAISDGA